MLHKIEGDRSNSLYWYRRAGKDRVGRSRADGRVEGNPGEDRELTRRTSMSTEITWLGHNAWSIRAGEHRLLLDPFLNDNPLSPIKADHVEADFILVSHGHGDHVGDTVEIAARTGATVIGIFEVCQWLSAHGVKNVHAMNLGGGHLFPFGRLTMTLALHSSSMPDGSYAGNPCGFVLAREEGAVYFACDTALFSDMKLIGAGGLDLAAVPDRRQLYDGARRCPGSGPPAQAPPGRADP